MWSCLCDPALDGCGAVTVAGSFSLRTGNTQSCGCLHSERTSAANSTRGRAGGLATRDRRPRAYTSWTNMLRRCENPGHPRYADWGGRGITVCERWHDFTAFLADMGERPPGMSLERKDNNGPYCRENCVWATPHQQQMNSRAFRLTPDVITEIRRLRATGMTLIAIGEILGLNRHTVSRALSGKTRQRSKTS